MKEKIKRLYMNFIYSIKIEIKSSLEKKLKMHENEINL